MSGPADHDDEGPDFDALFGETPEPGDVGRRPEDDAGPAAGSDPVRAATHEPAAAAAIATAPVAPRPSWRELLAFAAFTAIVVQLLGGLALSFHYQPSTDFAHASLTALEQDHKYGVSLRALHWLGASAVVGLVLVNLLMAFLAADHKRPGRAAWISGALILFVVVGFGITGELLPWTEQAVYATEVRTGLIAKAPEGELLRGIALGGGSIAEPTLTRFHVLHVVVLPALLIGLLVWHARARRRIGRPRFLTFGQALVGLAVTGGLAYGARELRAPLGAVFVPGDAGYEAWPEWYFLWLNKLLKLFPPELEAVPAFWIPNGLAAVLLLLPFLDFRRERAWRRRPVAILAAVVGLLTLTGLSIANHLERPKNAPGLPYDLSWNQVERRGYTLVRQEGCIECHRLERGGLTYGEQQHEAPELDDLYAEASIEEIAKIVQDAGRELGTLDMPSYGHLGSEDLRAIAIFLRRLGDDG
jgi:ubiquinol-cytochrome c reductase cytochrome b subunit